MTTVWRAIHVYCDDQDTVLADVVDPVIADARQRGLVRRTFFLRYWNGGPHLRLRFETPTCAADPTGELMGQIRNRISTLPRKRWDEKVYRTGAEAVLHIERSLGGSASEAIEPLQADGDVIPRVYIFDCNRYGRRNVDIVHDHFFVSSQLAFAVVLLVRKRPALRRMLAAYLSAAVTSTPGWDLAQTSSWFYDMAAWNASSPADSGPATLSSPEAREGLSAWVSTGRLPAWPAAVTQVVTAWSAELARYARAWTDACDEKGLAVEPALLDAVHLFANRIGLSLAQECQVYAFVAHVCALTLGEGELSAR